MRKVASGTRNSSERADLANKDFLRIQDAVTVTGLSSCYLRKGVKEGTIPHTKSGRTYYINMPAFRKQMGLE